MPVTYQIEGGRRFATGARERAQLRDVQQRRAEALSRR
jgi:hypothetical protein